MYLDIEEYPIILIFTIALCQHCKEELSLQIFQHIPTVLFVSGQKRCKEWDILQQNNHDISSIKN